MPLSGLCVMNPETLTICNTSLAHAVYEMLHRPVESATQSDIR